MEASFKENPQKYSEFGDSAYRISHGVSKFVFLGLGKIIGGIITG